MKNKLVLLIILVLAILGEAQQMGYPQPAEIRQYKERKIGERHFEEFLEENFKTNRTFTHLEIISSCSQEIIANNRQQSSQITNQTLIQNDHRANPLREGATHSTQFETYLPKSGGGLDRISCHKGSGNGKDYVIGKLLDMFRQNIEASVLYFSGHSTSNGYLVIDSGQDNEFISFDEIIKLYLDNRNANNIELLLILDSCYSGLWVNKLKNYQNIPSDVTISIQASSLPTQYSYDTEQGGLFTLNLLKVLRKEKNVQIAVKENQIPIYYSTGKGNCLGIGFNSWKEMERLQHLIR